MSQTFHELIMNLYPAKTPLVSLLGTTVADGKIHKGNPVQFITRTGAVEPKPQEAPEMAVQRAKVIAGLNARRDLEAALLIDFPGREQDEDNAPHMPGLLHLAAHQNTDQFDRQLKESMIQDMLKAIPTADAILMGGNIWERIQKQGWLDDNSQYLGVQVIPHAFALARSVLVLDTRKLKLALYHEFVHGESEDQTAVMARIAVTPEVEPQYLGIIKKVV